MDELKKGFKLSRHLWFPYGSLVEYFSLLMCMTPYMHICEKKLSGGKGFRFVFFTTNGCFGWNFKLGLGLIFVSMYYDDNRQLESVQYYTLFGYILIEKMNEESEREREGIFHFISFHLLHSDFLVPFLVVVV